MKNQSPKPIIIQLGELRVVVNAPDFVLTPEQYREIKEWWRQEIDRNTKQLLGVPDVD